MISLKDLIEISKYEWEIPKSYDDGMQVPVRIFANEKLLKGILLDSSLEQAVNSATLPGLVGSVCVMPDMHQGYGFPIGAIAATRVPEGVITPGGIGYDINCGVRLLASRIELLEVKQYLDQLARSIDHYCPSGLGGKSSIHLDNRDLEKICEQGSEWSFDKGMATQEDLLRTEGNGRLEGADPSVVSERAKERGKPQIGTMGSGNHFIEVDVVDDVFDTECANTMGLFPGFLVVQIHCGSRGFGHQICTDYVTEFQKFVSRNKINLRDRELAFAPIQSQEGSNYISAMLCAANYAFVNRQVLTYQIRRAFEEVLSKEVNDHYLFQVYDIAHNIAKFETHLVNNKELQVCVHRKGATRAFGPGSTDLPLDFQRIGQPVLVPGSMGTSSWVLTGTEDAMHKSFGSCCHGAGRMMSRHHAKKSIRGDKLKNELADAGIIIRTGSLGGLAEEAPEAYKNVDQVIETVSGSGIAKKVARLRPVAVIKG